MNYTIQILAINEEMYGYLMKTNVCRLGPGRRDTILIKTFT